MQLCAVQLCAVQLCAVQLCAVQLCAVQLCAVQLSAQYSKQSATSTSLSLEMVQKVGSMLPLDHVDALWKWLALPISKHPCTVAIHMGN